MCRHAIRKCFLKSRRTVSDPAKKKMVNTYEMKSEVVDRIGPAHNYGFGKPHHVCIYSERNIAAGRLAI
jgi:hypothetical protein